MKENERAQPRVAVPQRQQQADGGWRKAIGFNKAERNAKKAAASRRTPRDIEKMQRR
jgi:hypothetical protein